MSIESQAVLELSGISKSYPAPDGELSILESVNLDLSAGDALAVTGPSGSGKSTLLYIIGLLEHPSAGTVRILGHEPFLLSEAGQAAFRNQHIGFIFQDHHLLPQCTVLENVLLPTLAIDPEDAVESTGEQLEQQARDLLKRVGLEQRIDHLPARISGGERQRVAVCRALIRHPALLLADEPTGNLDGKTAGGVGDLLLEMASEFKTALICVTHSETLAARFPLRRELNAGLLEPV